MPECPQQDEPMQSAVHSVVTLFPNIMSSQASAPENITWPFTRQLPEKRVCSQQNIFSPSASAKHPLIRQLPENITWHNIVSKETRNSHFNRQSAIVAAYCGRSTCLLDLRGIHWCFVSKDYFITPSTYNWAKLPEDIFFYSNNARRIIWMLQRELAACCGCLPVICNCMSQYPLMTTL